MDLYEELRSILGELERDGVDHALCGGLALAVHGHPRATKDIAILARREDEAPVRACARRCGFTLEALPMEFSSSKIEVQRFTKLIEGRPLMLDVLWVGPTLEAIWRDRQRLAWKEGGLWVVSREGLVTLKLTAGRPQDLVDIQSLSTDEGRR